MTNFHSGTTNKKLLALTISLILMGCNTGTNDTAATGHEPEHGHNEASLPGRLMISDADSASVHVLNTEDLALVEQISVQNPISDLHVSPSFRYALAVQKQQGIVQVIDGGVWSEPHGDHSHDYTKTPVLLSGEFNEVTPSQFKIEGNKATLFYEGDETSGVSAQFKVLSDDSLGKGQELAHFAFPYSLQGIAQIWGDYVFTGVKGEGSTSQVPDRIGVLSSHNDHFHYEGMFEVTCPELADSALNSQKDVMFACADGVVVIQDGGDHFASKKITNPASITAGERIETILSSAKSTTALGLTASKQVFRITPETDVLTELNWRTNAEQNALAISMTEDTFALLNTDGTLLTFDVNHDFNKVADIKIWDEKVTLTGTQKIEMAFDPKTKLLYISNPANKTLVEVNMAQHKVNRVIDLAFTPSDLVWVGIN
ncbi:hypothetical protein MHO82_11120 [Vibrio sp. Of7-15]|uniref:hypothetical protein n=1 Tax=Vibrio sp. Of7-15 TaxID=2724879 RepID=UPI001EF2B30B|nr:hypothetical protein [Vibrio sp. Of7-15]MCG7497417.1 hypothetical protein [Vibrio sp. Of7-15]